MRNWSRIVRAPGDPRLSSKFGLRHLGLQETAGSAFGRGIALLPQRKEHVSHRLADAFDVRVRVLNHEALDPFGVGRSQPKADRTAVVVHVVHGVAHADLVEQTLGRLGQVVERVRVLARSGRRRVPESDVVGRDHAETVGQARDQVTVHVRRGREAVQQDDHRSLRVAGLSVEDLLAIDHSGAGVHLGHSGGPSGGGNGKYVQRDRSCKQGQ